MRGKQVKIEPGDIAGSELEKCAKTGKRGVMVVRRASIILERDEADGRKPLTQAAIAERIGVTRQAVNDAKQAYLAADSAPAFLPSKKRGMPPVQPKITGAVQARMIARACGPVPDGCAQWSVRLLADQRVELNAIKAISCKSVHGLLKNTL